MKIFVILKPFASKSRRPYKILIENFKCKNRKSREKISPCTNILPSKLEKKRAIGHLYISQKGKKTVFLKVSTAVQSQ